jgi:hypothetical protein
VIVPAAAKLAIFIDETYQVVEPERPNTFYFLASVFLDASKIGEQRQQVLDLAQTNSWHSHEQLRSSEGRLRFQQMNSWIAQNAAGAIFAKIPMIDGDRLGEATRAKLIRNLVIELVAMKGETNLQFVYEKRLDGIQVNADLRTISELKRLGHVGSELEIRSRTKTQEPLLWLADVVASAYRREHLFGKNSYWADLDERIKVVRT